MIADDRAGTVYGYRHNNRGRLDRVSVGAQVRADYVYDALERLAIRTTQNMTPSGTTHYVYDRAGHLLAETSDTGTTIREYVWLDDMPLAVVADVDTATPQLWYVHADHLDRPIKMTDDSKAVVWDAVFRPFGEVVSIAGAASNNLRFPGQYFLIEAGLHYNWHRHYDPTLGRYLQTDPLEFVDGANVYAYVLSAPTMYVDAEGRFIAPVLIGAGAGLVIGAGIDLSLQLIQNGFDWRCLDLSRLWWAGFEGAAWGAIFGPVGRMAWLGREISFGKELRIAPFGNRTGHPTGRWPHYHRRNVDPATGETAPGGTMKRHRPWDRKGTDRSFWDRF